MVPVGRLSLSDFDEDALLEPWEKKGRAAHGDLRRREVKSDTIGVWKLLGVRTSRPTDMIEI
jgi:hypothetical protein